jgi:hypothetical protein
VNPYPNSRLGQIFHFLHSPCASFKTILVCVTRDSGLQLLQLAVVGFPHEQIATVPAIPLLEAGPTSTDSSLEFVAILDKVSQLFNKSCWLSRHRRCDQLPLWYWVSGKFCPITRRGANNMTLAPIPAEHRAATANQTRRSSPSAVEPTPSRSVALVARGKHRTFHSAGPGASPLLGLRFGLSSLLSANTAVSFKTVTTAAEAESSREAY